MVLLILGVLMLYLGVNGVMFWFSLHSGTDLVAKDYYSRAERYNDTIAAEAASRATGWRARVTADSAADGALTLVVADAAGRPVTGLTGEALAYRPSDAALDQALALSELPGQPGAYRLRFARPARGLWEVSLDLRADGGRLDQRLRVVTP
jgi:nitrogen fixation protein FixH